MTRRVKAWLHDRSSRRGERGAAMVETAIVLPIVLLLTFGVIDFGLAFNDAATMRSASRSGARIGSALSKDPTQLGAIVNAVNVSLHSVNNAKPEHLVVYLATGLAGPVTSCADVPADPDMSPDCVDMTVTGPPSAPFEAPTDPTAWPVSRENACPAIPGVPTDRIGVTIRGKYNFLTSLVATSVSLDESTIIDLEPTTSVSCAPSGP